MNSISDYNIFNSVNPDTLTPKEKKPMPFPLENFDQDISNAYQLLDRILGKIQAAQQNPVNDTPARKRKLKSIKYKAKSCMQMVREISTSCADLWY
jgi:hypothetical protein